VNNTAFDILWIHSQGETGVTTVVKSISTAWGSLPFGGGPPDGTPARVGIWSDPNGDRNPTDAVLLGSANTVVTGSNTDALQTVQISPSVLVTGRYFIGASCTGGTFQAPLDQTTAPGAGFVWIVGDASGTINYNSIGTSSIPPLDEDNVAPGHWLLQGDCKDIDITEFCGVTAPGDCPCGNDGLIGNGCANSVNAAGAHLSGAGNPIVSADNVSVSASGVRRGNPTLGLFFSGSEVAPAPVNDGLLCAGAPICRLWTWSIPGPGGGTITLTGPDASTIPPNVSISQRSADLGRRSRTARRACTPCGTATRRTSPARRPRCRTTRTRSGSSGRSDSTGAAERSAASFGLVRGVDPRVGPAPFPSRSLGSPVGGRAAKLARPHGDPPDPGRRVLGEALPGQPRGRVSPRVRARRALDAGRSRGR
jgi:hypothetical protein